MKFKVWLTVLGALVLGACAHDHHHRYGPFTPPNPAQPTVTLRSDGKLVVNQEPLYVPKDGVVTFRLPPGSGLSFPEDGVRVVGRIKNEEGKPIPLDTRSNDAFLKICSHARIADGKDGTTDTQSLVCRFPTYGKVQRGLYAYEVTVTGPQGTGTITLDPTLWPPGP